jgi:predicted nucleic acid-binding protein
MTAPTETPQFRTKTPTYNSLQAIGSLREKRVLTLDSNVFIAALKTDENTREKCARILSKVSKEFALTEPSIVYQEVCGTLARKMSYKVANKAKEQLDFMVDPMLMESCDRKLCLSAFALCSKYNIYAIDALYLQVAIANRAILVSLDKEDFIDKVKNNKPPIEVYTVSEFPY